MQPRKKYLVGMIPTLLILLATILSACGGSGNSTGPAAGQKAPDDKQIYHTALAGIQDIKTFDPAMATTETSIDAISKVFTGMVQLNDKLEVVPELAQSWQASSDGLTYTFKLRPSLKFSNGDPLTSKDVVYSIDRALDPKLNSPASPSYLNLVKDYDKRLGGKVPTLIGDSLMTPDDNTVVIKLNTPASYFLATLTYNTAFVVNKKLVDKYGNKFTDHIGEGAGTGPWTVKEYTHGQRIVYIPNPNYTFAKPQLKEVITTFVKDSETAYQEYQNGQIDTSGVPSTHLKEVMSSPEFHKYGILANFYFGMNFLAKPFDNLKIRQAFALAINKTQIVHTVYHDIQIPTNHIVPEGMPGYDTNLKGPDGTSSTNGNPEKAKELFQQGLKEAGYASASALPKITLKYPSGSDDTNNQMAACVQQWKDVLGVTVTPEATDFETLSASLPKTVGNNSVQFFYSGWLQDYPDPQDFLTLQFAKDSPNNQTNYGQNSATNASTQQDIQKKLAAADIELDKTKRMQEYNDAEQQLVNDVAWMPMWQERVTRLLKPYVVGRVFNAGDIIPPQDWANIYIAQH